MENKNLIIGIALVGTAIYLYTKRKKENVTPVIITPAKMPIASGGLIGEDYDSQCYGESGKVRPALTEKEAMMKVVRTCYDKFGKRKDFNPNLPITETKSNMCGACSGANGECWD